MSSLAAVAGFCVVGLAPASAQIGAPPPQVEDGPVVRGDMRASPLRLTQDQKNTIAEAVRRDNKAAEPAVSFVASVGAPVPPAIELYMLPDAALAKVPAAKIVKYTVINNQLVLVDPTNMRIVDVIPQ
jgi:hypothetical protein